MRHLLAVPHLQRLVALDLLLQLQQPVEERLGRGRASGDVNIYGHNPVAATHNSVRVVVVATAVGTANGEKGAHGGVEGSVASLADLRKRSRGIAADLWTVGLFL